MKRTIPAVLAVVATAALAGCGGGGESSDSHVSAKAAKTGVERAARVKLVSAPVPDEAVEQGLRASYTNAGTVAKDRQAVALFVLDDAGAAEKVKELVGGSASGRSRLIVHDEVLVVYAAAGTDRGDQVAKAVKAL
jgi:hypothetical protein